MSSHSEPGDAKSIDDVLGDDHERLGCLLGQLRDQIRRREKNARQSLEQFDEGLVRHMTWEETALFPAVLDHATAAQRKSIESLYIDHERLRETLETLKSAVAEDDFSAADKSADWLETLLKGHNYDEEHGVYEESDKLLAVEERERLLGKFRLSP